MCFLRIVDSAMSKNLLFPHGKNDLCVIDVHVVEPNYEDGIIPAPINPDLSHTRVPRTVPRNSRNRSNEMYDDDGFPHIVSQ